jgi:hypothetical protein
MDGLNKKSKKEEEILNPKNLMLIIQKEIENEKIKLKEFIKKIYYDCMKKIKEAINIGSTDIFYKVPLENSEYKNYNSIKCLNYIEKKLRKNNFKTFIEENENMIFITWKFLF